MPVEGCQREFLAGQLEADLARGFVHVLDAFDGGTHRGGPRDLERDKGTGHGEGSIGRVRRSALVLTQERVFRVSRTHDVLAAALGNLDHGVS
ncbi:hypothetical protein PJL18_02913 [Paenarthrobacter nicotinovorans]|nr:hypothetical protein [Paenarthrobacter nicotinovorans]